MEKLSNEMILLKDAKLHVGPIDKNPETTRLIEETRERQIEVLKLKQVDKESLKMVVQL